MASLRQIAANRQNAQHSTGPVTDEGKDASRRNALKHGLTGSDVLLDGERDAVEQRKAEWRNNYLLETPEQEWVFEQMVVNSIRLERCHQEESAIRLGESQRAAFCWDDDRRDEAAEIAGKLSKRPNLVSRQLQRTKQGAEWMIDCWRMLGKAHERNGEWTESQTALALDLLGTPIEFRDDRTIDDPQATLAREIANLERRLTQSLNAFDEMERDAAIAGCPITPSKAMNNLRRHEAACLRRYQWAASQLQRVQPAEPAPSTNQTQCDSGQDTRDDSVAPSDWGREFSPVMSQSSPSAHSNPQRRHSYRP